ncbi:hypothetical protein NVP2275O_124 [Vibrio phage 2.275.O._10N.286.54.E11]|nr:hypothetical protein NVP2275O_124 [Vibrio phage 2.275.O._10N.286.54.E11]
MSLIKLFCDVQRTRSNAAKDALCEGLMERRAPSDLAIGMLRILMKEGHSFRPKDAPLFDKLSKHYHRDIVKLNTSSDPEAWDKVHFPTEKYLAAGKIISDLEIADLSNPTEEDLITIALAGITDEEFETFKSYELTMQP